MKPRGVCWRAFGKAKKPEMFLFPTSPALPTKGDSCCAVTAVPRASFLSLYLCCIPPARYILHTQSTTYRIPLLCNLLQGGCYSSSLASCLAVRPKRRGAHNTIRWGELCSAAQYTLCCCYPHFCSFLFVRFCFIRGNFGSNNKWARGTFVHGRNFILPPSHVCAISVTYTPKGKKILGLTE